MAVQTQLAGPGTLAPPVFPYPVADAPPRSTVSTVRPFGLTRAVPVAADPKDVGPALTLCPVLQISVTEDGTPFIHAPSMKSAFLTKSQTKEDNQLATDTDNDTD
ncbi:putative ATP-grasp-modified RiPP [Streptomyces sp. LX-29]|uniref:putative ATP-grasp-modified RiPP n=1 Tax=Streptomyces sp. LX-29 TaxID=2900152 RepID=UPI00240DEEDF|nr:putative ATP-grasp-modified RiPP [Streptomyces sp. LX-29]WFB06424.1 putative ATP-grasp-modified RiPP [Streptomyces sp. LX-29]